MTMATSIIINDDQDNGLEIKSDSDIVDVTDEASGERTLTVNAPYDVYPPLTEEPCYFIPGNANINGDIISCSSVTVVEHKDQNVEITIKG